MTIDKIKKDVSEYYTNKIKKFGLTPKGVDWNSKESQELRFEQLLSVCKKEKFFSINDYGCGYGSLFEHMIDSKFSFNYFGFDISREMIKNAKEKYKSYKNCQFTFNENDIKKTDFTIASGILNVKLRYKNEEWQEYILNVIEKLNLSSIKGFAFNVLTSYSDKEFMREDLYYADPLYLFDHCKKKYSKYVALLHDYPLYEFTITVKKEI